MSMTDGNAKRDGLGRRDLLHYSSAHALSIAAAAATLSASPARAQRRPLSLLFEVLDPGMVRV
jgi:hypothetical protein